MIETKFSKRIEKINKRKLQKEKKNGKEFI